MQFLADIHSNRCLKMSYRDAIEGLSLNDQNQITLCCVMRNSRATAGNLVELVSGMLEYVVILHVKDGNDVRTVYCGKSNSQSDAIMLFKSYILLGKKASITVE